MKTKIFLLLFVSLASTWTAPTSLPLVMKIGDGQIDAIGLITNIDVVLNEAPQGLSGYNISISLSDKEIAEIISITFPEWATIHFSTPTPADSLYIKAVDLNDRIKPGNKNIILISLMIRGDHYGSTRIIARVIKMDDDHGNPLDLIIEHGKLMVGGTLSSSTTTTSSTLITATTPTATVVTTLITTTPNGTQPPTVTITIITTTPPTATTTGTTLTMITAIPLAGGGPRLDIITSVIVLVTVFSVMMIMVSYLKMGIPRCPVCGIKASSRISRFCRRCGARLK